MIAYVNLQCAGGGCGKIKIMQRRIKAIIGILLLAGFGSAVYLNLDRIQSFFFVPRQPQNSSFYQTPQGTSDSPIAQLEQEKNMEIIAENLNIPWEIVFLPGGEILVTERPGNLIKISPERKVIQKIEGVEHVGEGGLLGMALHPNFEDTRWLYLYLTTPTAEGLINRVERYRFENNTLSSREVILDDIPGASYHDGGRIAFGPDNYLYITTGDAGNTQLAEDTNSLSGKILRINADGSVPDDNPFGNEVYSYGHRNPQGLAWDSQGRLWSTEHGPSGAQSGFDEINLIEKGNNYGWPVIRGSETAEGMVSPVIQSGATDTWAPAGAVVYKGTIYFAGLRGSSLYAADIVSESELNLQAYLREQFGRLRAVVLGPDNYLYVSTSNRDGRGRVQEGDDKIIRVNPKSFPRQQ